ncbi:MAG: hypothetical protein AAFP82_10710 [Bacteroidota bacterium]
MAISIFEDIFNPNHLMIGVSKYQRGRTYIKLGELNKAFNDFKSSETILANDSENYINWVIYYAAKYQQEEALSKLEEAIELGYNDLEWLKTNDTISNLKKEKRFKQIIKKLEKKHKK